MNLNDEYLRDWFKCLTFGQYASEVCLSGLNRAMLEKWKWKIPFISMRARSRMHFMAEEKKHQGSSRICGLFFFVWNFRLSMFANGEEKLCAWRKSDETDLALLDRARLCTWYGSLAVLATEHYDNRTNSRWPNNQGRNAMTNRKGTRYNYPPLNYQIATILGLHVYVRLLSTIEDKTMVYQGSSLISLILPNKKHQKPQYPIVATR